MARQPVSKGGTAKIRFIMLEAEIPEGDLSEITTAIQNALKPPVVMTQRLPPARRVLTSVNGEAEAESVEPESEDEDEELVLEQASERAPRDSKPRKYPTPKVLDLDLTSDLSLSDYVAQHSPKNDLERYLVIAAWFKEHRGTPVITANHVYTGYRSMKWPAGIGDFAAPLRKLKAEQFVSGAGKSQ